MIQIFFKIFFRSLYRNKVFYWINLSGLSLGIGCGILIFWWVLDELSVDGFHRDKNIYSVYERVFSEGNVDASYYTAGLLASELKRKMPEVRYATAFDGDESATFEAGKKILTIRGAAADSDFFKMFSYRLLSGNSGNALNGADKIAISRKMAVLFFGSPYTAINKTIRYQNTRNFIVTAVFENLPSNSSERFDFILNWQQHLKELGWLKFWIYRNPKTYISLYPGVSSGLLELRIRNFIDAYVSNSTGLRFELGLQKYENVYLYSEFRNGVPTAGRITYVKMFIAVAVFILFLACINFINLSTALLLKRAREVGIRKTIGASQFSVMLQFFGEVMFLIIIAVALALILLMVFLPEFNRLTGKSLAFGFSNISFWEFLGTLILLIGVLAGTYPAAILSSFKPVKVLKGFFKMDKRAVRFRYGLVVFQFFISVVLVIYVSVVSEQVHFLEHQSLGLKKADLIYVPLQGNLSSKFHILKQVISSEPGILGVTLADQEPTDAHAHAYDMNWPGKDPNTKLVVVHMTVGNDYLKFMGIKLLAGRDFFEESANSEMKTSVSYIINETASKLTGYSDPIGKPLSVFGGTGKIIGVVKDFHFQSLHDPIPPLVILQDDNLQDGIALIRVEHGMTRKAISTIQKVCKELEPKIPVVYSFADDEYKLFYQTEHIVAKVSVAFTVLAIIIACLGLLGLTIFTLEQRFKEITIRKVLGAGRSNILLLLLTNFIRPVLIAFIIGVPVAWLIAFRWLQDYAYRITLSPFLFVMACMIILCLASITIIYQVLKASSVSLIKYLRET